MTKEQFKKTFFSNNFYWVNEQNYKQLQEIGIEMGCLCHTMKKEIINWHIGFKNLGFRTYTENGGITVFQKEPFLSNGEVCTDFNLMLSKYKSL